MFHFTIFFFFRIYRIFIISKKKIVLLSTGGDVIYVRYVNYYAFYYVLQFIFNSIVKYVFLNETVFVRMYFFYFCN